MEVYTIESANIKSLMHWLGCISAQAIAPAFEPTVGDYDEDGITDLTVKFDRQALSANLCLDDVAIVIEGDLTTGEHFKGQADTVGKLEDKQWRLPNQRRPPMQFYCGIDLSARTSQVCVIDEGISVLVQKKVRNKLPRIIELIEPYKNNLQAVVESTFNRYWLVDGLQEAGFDITLAHPFGL